MGVGERISGCIGALYVGRFAGGPYFSVFTSNAHIHYVG